MPVPKQAIKMAGTKHMTRNPEEVWYCEVNRIDITDPTNRGLKESADSCTILAHEATDTKRKSKKVQKPPAGGGARNKTITKSKNNKRSKVTKGSHGVKRGK